MSVCCICLVIAYTSFTNITLGAVSTSDMKLSPCENYLSKAFVSETFQYLIKMSHLHFLAKELRVINVGLI